MIVWDLYRFYPNQFAQARATLSAKREKIPGGWPKMAVVLDVVCGGVWHDKRVYWHRCRPRLCAEHGNYLTEFL